MIGQIIGYERIQIQKEVEEKGKMQTVVIPACILHIQTELPNNLPIGKEIEIKVAQKQEEQLE